MGDLDLKIRGGKRSHKKLKDLNTEEYTHLTKEQYRLLTQKRNADSLHTHEFSKVFKGISSYNDGGSITDHGALGGLGDDDHLQYLLLAGRGGQTVNDNVTINGEIETTSTKGIIVPYSDGYGFTLSGYPTTGLYFNVTSAQFEFHLGGEVMAIINAVTGAGDITAKRDLLADRFVIAQDAIQSGDYFKALGTGHALEIAQNCYAFVQTGLLTTGLYFNNVTGAIEMHNAGVIKHTFDMLNGDYTSARNIIATGSIATGITTKTGAYTITASDGVVLADATSAAFTVTLPTAVGITGRRYTIKKIDSSANIVTVDGNGSETIDGDATMDLTLKDEVIEIISDGSNWFII